MSAPSPEEGFYPHIESVTDSLGNAFHGTPNYGNGLVRTRNTLRPGDIVTFRCVAVDPHNRSIRIRLQANSGYEDKVSTDGSPVEFTWHVGDRDVQVNGTVKIVIRALETEFHRFGVVGDQSTYFQYRVDPPLHAV